jgi:hypothetical protein
MLPGVNREDTIGFAEIHSSQHNRVTAI